MSIRTRVITLVIPMLAVTGSAFALTAPGTPGPDVNTNASAELSAKANVDLRAAQSALDEAQAALTSGADSARAQADALFQAGSADLMTASTEMSAAARADLHLTSGVFPSFALNSSHVATDMAGAVQLYTSDVPVGQLIQAIDTQLATANSMQSSTTSSVVDGLTQTRSYLSTVEASLEGGANASVPSSVNSGSDSGLATSGPAPTTSAHASGQASGHLVVRPAPVAPPVSPKTEDTTSTTDAPAPASDPGPSGVSVSGGIGVSGTAGVGS